MFARSSKARITTNALMPLSACVGVGAVLGIHLVRQFQPTRFPPESAVYRKTDENPSSHRRHCQARAGADFGNVTRGGIDRWNRCSMMSHNLPTGRFAGHRLNNA